MPTRNMTAELPVVLDVLSDDLENCFLFGEGACSKRSANTTDEQRYKL